MAESGITTVHGLRDRFNEALTSHRWNQTLSLLLRIEGKGKGILQRHQIIQEENEKKLNDGDFSEILRATQEAIVLPPWIALAVRTRPGVWEYIRVNVHALVVEELTVAEYLRLKEDVVDGSTNGDFVLELDFEPFNASVPRPTLSKSIGNGVEFLNRHLSAKLFHDKESMHPLLEFLKVHCHKAKNMMLNDNIENLDSLRHVLRKAEECLGTLPAETPYAEFECEGN